MNFFLPFHFILFCYLSLYCFPNYFLIMSQNIDKIRICDDHQSLLLIVRLASKLFDLYFFLIDKT
jgi:hypothetical protein